MNKKKVSVLAIIEEIGNISSSGAIVNWNLCNLLGPIVEKLDILTLDNISKELINSWEYGKVFTHPKENLSKFQKVLLKIPKVRGIISYFSGNDFIHFNRIKNIRRFLNKHIINYDIVLLISGGSGFSPHRAITKRRYKSYKKVAIFHDPYPITCYPPPYAINSSLYFFQKRELQKSLKNLDYIIFPSQKLNEWYQNDYVFDTKKVRIIPHAVKFDYKLTNDIIENNKDSEVLITHAGTLLGPRDPYTILKVASDINERRIKFEFYGDVNKGLKPKLKEFANSKNIYFENARIPYSDALDKLLKSDFQLIIEAHSDFSPFLPTKFVDYVNIGKPIIALTPYNSEISRLLGDDYVLKCEINDEKIIREILSERIFNEEIVKNSIRRIEALKKYFSSENIISSYLNLF
jgi:hypothetical protein